MYPVGTWVNQGTKERLFERWATSGWRSEAAFVRALLEAEIERQNPLPQAEAATEGKEGVKVGPPNVEEE